MKRTKIKNSITRHRRSFLLHFEDPYYETEYQKLVKLLKKL